MADSKITALASIGTGTDPANDPLVIVDVSDILPGGMSLTGTTKKVTLNNLLACSPTATLASATITGDLTARTTGLTVNSSGVGIGTNSQSSFLGNSPKKLVIGDGTQTPALTLYGGSANVGGLYFADGTVGNQAYRGFVEYDHNTDSFGLGISGSLAMTLNATGLGVGVTPSAGKGCLQLSSGINFPATQVASSDANTLDDYEEGTFTPTIVGATTAGVGTYSNQNGFYTKVGRLVTITVYLNWTAHTGTGDMRFGNFPFASANVAGNYNGINIAFLNNIALTASNVLYGSIPFGFTYAAALQCPVGGGAASAVPIDTAGEIAFTATYFV